MDTYGPLDVAYLFFKARAFNFLVRYLPFNWTESPNIFRKK